MRGNTDRDGVEAGGGEIGHRTIAHFWHHQCQWPRPERFGKPQRRRIETADPLRGLKIKDMGDQRVERRPSLGLVEPRDGGRIIGIGAEPIDRLGRECDQAAIGEAMCRGSQGGLVHGQNLRFEPHIHWDLSPQFRFLR